MTARTLVVAGLVTWCSVLAAGKVAWSQTPKAAAPAPAKDGWEEIDERLLFLMVRLANVEASLEAVEGAISKVSGKRSARVADAKRAVKGNELMDRNAGGPMRWTEFYGRTAEKFFYHPVDSSTTYHTTTVLSQQSPQFDNQSADGVPSRQGLPVHQRPPQFDYIYRANRDALARAEKEAAELATKINALLERRAALEAEQAGLWCEIAFRAVARHDLARKPLYRFELAGVSTETKDQERAEAMKAAATFVRAAMEVIADAQEDQARALGRVKVDVAQAREALGDAWVRQAYLGVQVTDVKTPAGKFAALAKRLDDVAANLSDSHAVAIDGDRFKDEQRKDTFRALLQQSLVSYSQIILALDEMADAMAREWELKPNLNKPLMNIVRTDSTPLNITTDFSAGRSFQLPSKIISLTFDDDGTSSEPRSDWTAIVDSADRKLIESAQDVDVVEGHRGKGLRFNGRSSVVCTSVPLNDVRSVAFWLRVHAFNEPFRLLSSHDAKGAAFGVNCGVNGGASLRKFSMEWGGPARWEFAEFDHRLTDDKWHHLTFSFNWNRGNLIYAVDGRPSEPIACTSQSAAFTAKFTISNAYEEAALNGVVDDFQLSSVPLSSDEIRAAWAKLRK